MKNKEKHGCETLLYNVRISDTRNKTKTYTNIKNTAYKSQSKTEFSTVLECRTESRSLQRIKWKGF